MLYAAEKAIMGALLKKRADEGSDNTKQADTKPAEVWITAVLAEYASMYSAFILFVL